MILARWAGSNLVGPRSPTDCLFIRRNSLRTTIGPQLEKSYCCGVGYRLVLIRLRCEAGTNGTVFSAADVGRGGELREIRMACAVDKEGTEAPQFASESRTSTGSAPAETSSTTTATIAPAKRTAQPRPGDDYPCLGCEPVEDPDAPATATAIHEGQGRDAVIPDLPARPAEDGVHVDADVAGGDCHGDDELFRAGRVGHRGLWDAVRGLWVSGRVRPERDRVCGRHERYHERWCIREGEVDALDWIDDAGNFVAFKGGLNGAKERAIK